MSQIDQLEKLWELKQSGALNEVEYANAKSQILASEISQQIENKTGEIATESPSPDIPKGPKNTAIIVCLLTLLMLFAISIFGPRRLLFLVLSKDMSEDEYKKYAYEVEKDGSGSTFKVININNASQKIVNEITIYQEHAYFVKVANDKPLISLHHAYVSMSDIHDITKDHSPKVDGIQSEDRFSVSFVYFRR